MIPWNLKGVDHILLSYINGMAGLCLKFVQISVFYVKWWNDTQDKIRKILMVSRWQEFPPIYHTFISRLRKNWSLPDWYSIAVWRVLQIINVKRYISDFNVKTIKIHYSGRWHTYGIYFWSISFVCEASVKIAGVIVLVMTENFRWQLQRSIAWHCKTYHDIKTKLASILCFLETTWWPYN